MKRFFKKILFESPKRGGYTYVKPSNKDLSADLKNEYKKAKHFGGKEQSYEYRPIRNFLNSRVGKNWDDIYSEMSKEFSGYTGSILKDAINFHVTFKVYLDENGEWRDSQDRRIEPSFSSWTQFFVHPKTNALCKIAGDRERYRRKKYPKTIVQLNGKRYYKFEEIWYEVEVEKLPSTKSDVFYQDELFSRRNWSIDSFKAYRKYGESLICISKKQANSRICRKLNEIRVD